MFCIYSFLLFVQPLARMGAAVMGVDAVEKNIKIARLHAVWSFSISKCDMLMLIDGNGIEIQTTGCHYFLRESTL